jgi:hypothetical protein
MQRSAGQINKPIFIVGSGRSGSTILTWCLGQHPNILPQEESDWLGPFAIDAASGYQRGTARGERGQLSANFVQRESFLAFLGQTINELILGHRKQFENMDLRRRAGWSDPPFKISRSAKEPKSRWVDGTPEYSFYICGLRKLFPEARFIHLVRDVDSVVHSLLNFYPGGVRLVASEQSAYERWLRAVTACVEAEEAYGPHVVYRMRYSDLRDHPERSMKALLDFLGEPYAAECLEPLRERINSADVPPDFQSFDPATDQGQVEKARTLSLELQQRPQKSDSSAAVTARMEAQFNERIRYFCDLDENYSSAQKIIRELQKDHGAIDFPASPPTYL